MHLEVAVFDLVAAPISEMLVNKTRKPTRQEDDHFIFDVVLHMFVLSSMLGVSSSITVLLGIRPEPTAEGRTISHRGIAEGTLTTTVNFIPLLTSTKDKPTLVPVEMRP